MGYIKIKPVEEVIRKLFSQKDTVTFKEMVEAGFPTKKSLCYADAIAMEAGDLNGRLYQYELALDVALTLYANEGLVYPDQGRNILVSCAKYDPEGQVSMGIRRALEQWTTPAPPWLDHPQILNESADFLDCHELIIHWALPQNEDAEKAREVVWKVGKSLFNYPYIGSFDL